MKWNDHVAVDHTNQQEHPKWSDRYDFHPRTETFDYRMRPALPSTNPELRIIFDHLPLLKLVCFHVSLLISCDVNNRSLFLRIRYILFRIYDKNSHLDFTS